MRTILVLGTMMSATVFGQVGGPTPGYVFDNFAREVRPMRGAVGSAYLGNALLKDADAASVSGDGTMAIASRFGSIELVSGFDSSAPVTVALTQEPGEALFAWSGHDVAVVFAGTRKARIWRNADTKSDAAAIDLSGIDGAITGAALDGERLVIESKGGLYLALGGEVSRIAEVTDPGAMLIAGADLYVASRGTNQVLRIHDYAGQATTEIFAEAASPVGLRISRQRLLVASAETRSVDAFDTTTKERIGSVELDFVPTRLQALGAGALALLNNGAPDEPLYVLDSGDSLQVYFVPAGREQ